MSILDFINKVNNLNLTEFKDTKDLNKIMVLFSREITSENILELTKELNKLVGKDDVNK